MRSIKKIRIYYCGDKQEGDNDFMIPINRAAVADFSKKDKSKEIPGKDDSELYPIYIHSLTNFSDLTRNYSTYEMAHWTNYADRFCNSKKGPSQNTKGYKRGSIVFVDLGAGNFGHEPSYTHPAVVLQQNRVSIMVAPCSSKKYGCGYPKIVDATSENGFTTNTGIQTDSIRWISKDRVISWLGRVDSSILDCIDSILLEGIPTHEREILEKDNAISQLEEEKSAVEEENDTLKSEKASLEEKIKKLNEEIAQLKESISSRME